ncbi:sugar phosphate isomerase/epimerase [Isoptericola jiangsuensis]|uniref:Sugar phosphate isomerase/epimerase n=1 Tax=Isoptericola jiangsuensis TaxID=548579 RepID=A0A2A9ETM0_9MICO|nr:sugar phosphate isomerase/epimerase [Isoptericola jiangsuensis]PFG41612.1 sugar phosphate isomerase/epimerase [Isoptericola jiangsuensis]
MKITTKTRRILATSALGAVLAAGAFAAGPASAVPEHPHADDYPGQGQGRTLPANKVGIQLFSYLGWQSQIGIDGVLDELEDVGLRNVEPFGNPGSFGSYGSYTAGEFRGELRDRGIKAPSSHGSVDEATFDTTLQNAKDLGQKFVGSGGFAAPGIQGGYDNVVATAETMNRLGERSVKNGTGKFFGHNHAGEFQTMYTDPETGELKSAWHILEEHTDPRYVAFEVDVYWATAAGVDVVDLLNTYGDRIDLLHIKDGHAPFTRATLTDVGEGDIDWAPILRAAHGKVDFYILERDGAPSDVEFAQDSFEYLTNLRY